MEFLLSILLFVSLIVNVFAFNYVRYLLGELSFVSENLGALFKMVTEFKKHLSDVYELERFYGDQTLESLLRHSSELVEVLEDFEEIFSLSENDLDEEDAVGEEETDDQETP
jgi:hypothetical protein